MASENVRCSFPCPVHPATSLVRLRRQAEQTRHHGVHPEQARLRPLDRLWGPAARTLQFEVRTHFLEGGLQVPPSPVGLDDLLGGHARPRAEEVFVSVRSLQVAHVHPAQLVPAPAPPCTSVPSPSPPLPSSALLRTTPPQAASSSWSWPPPVRGVSILSPLTGGRPFGFFPSAVRRTSGRRQVQRRIGIEPADEVQSSLLLAAKAGQVVAGEARVGRDEEGSAGGTSDAAQRASA